MLVGAAYSACAEHVRQVKAASLRPFLYSIAQGIEALTPEDAARALEQEKLKARRDGILTVYAIEAALSKPAPAVEPEKR